MHHPPMRSSELSKPPTSSNSAGKRTSEACSRCRQRKIRCSGERPSCGTCNRKGVDSECTYDSTQNVENRIGALEVVVADLQSRVTQVESSIGSLAVPPTAHLLGHGDGRAGTLAPSASAAQYPHYSPTFQQKANDAANLSGGHSGNRLVHRDYGLLAHGAGNQAATDTGGALAAGADPFVFINQVPSDDTASQATSTEGLLPSTTIGDGLGNVPPRLNSRSMDDGMGVNRSYWAREEYM